MSVRRAHQQARRANRVNKRYTRSLVAREPARSTLSPAQEHMEETAPAPEWRAPSASLLGLLGAAAAAPARKAFTRRKT